MRVEFVVFALTHNSLSIDQSYLIPNSYKVSVIPGLLSYTLFSDSIQDKFLSRFGMYMYFTYSVTGWISSEFYTSVLQLSVEPQRTNIYPLAWIRPCSSLDLNHLWFGVFLGVYLIISIIFYTGRISPILNLHFSVLEFNLLYRIWRA